MLGDGYIEFFKDEWVAKQMSIARRLGVPSRDEERELIIKAQGGCADSRENLVIRHTPFVVTIAKKYRGLGVEMIDLFQCGRMGVNKSITKYDLENRECRFISFAVWWIRQEMLSEIQNRGQGIRVPVNKAKDLAKVRRLVAVARANGRDVSVEDVSDEVGISRELAADLIPVSVAPMSLNGNIRADGNENGDEVGDTIACEYHDDVADSDELRWALEMIERHPKMSRRMKYVIIQRFMHGRTLEDIGAEVGVSRERIRQICNQGIGLAQRAAKDYDRRCGFTVGDRRSMLSMGG